jgi:hypothetical protein
MIFHTAARDCLYLNWALPAAGLPPLAPPLVYDMCDSAEGRSVFVSAALFRLEGLHLQTVPLLKLSHPQFSLRLCIRDGDGLPAVLLWRVIIPAWAVPGARLVARQPASAGRFSYPKDATGATGELRWEVRRKRSLAFRAEPGVAAASEGPNLGSWERTVNYFLRRRRGYFYSFGKLRVFEFTPVEVDAVPLRVNVERDGLLPECLEVQGLESWPPLHSAWLCPRQSFVFHLGSVPERALGRSVPAPG